MKAEELVKYLWKFAPDSTVAFMVGDKAKHVLYKVDKVSGITDQGYPLIMIACDGEEEMNGEDNLRQPEREG